MLFRISKKFEGTFRCKALGVDPPAPGPFLAWYVDTFTVPGFGRFVICSEEHSLYSLVIPLGAKRSLPLMMENFFVNHTRLLDALDLQHLPVSNNPVFVTRTNRHITGSQNELILQVRFFLGNSAPPLNQQIFEQLHHEANSCPLGYLKMESPREIARVLAQRMQKP